MMNLQELRVLTDIHLLVLQDEAGDNGILGAPLGTTKFCAEFLLMKLSAELNSLHLLQEIPDAHRAYHVQRATASLCRFTHLMRITQPSVLPDIAVKLDAEQASTFCCH